MSNISQEDNVGKPSGCFTRNFRHLYREQHNTFPFVSNYRRTEILLDWDILTRHRDVHSHLSKSNYRQDVKKISQLLMNSPHQNTAASRCVGLFDTLPTQTSFVQLWNSISRSGKIRIQFSFHHIWFQSTVDYSTQNIQDQDRICIKFNKNKKGPCIFFDRNFYLPALASQKYCHL